MAHYKIIIGHNGVCFIKNGALFLWHESWNLL